MNELQVIKKRWEVTNLTSGEIAWLIEQVEEYQQWFKVASQNVRDKEETISRQQKEIDESTDQNMMKSEDILILKEKIEELEQELKQREIQTK